MDSKSFRLSILALVTTVVLVGVVVYAANRDKIHALIGGESSYEEASEVSEEAVVTETTEYGEQIGDNLKGFLTADDFFDKSEQRPSVVVVVDNVPVPANAEDSGVEDTTDLLEVPGLEKSNDVKPEDAEAPTDKPDEDKSGEDKSKQENPEQEGSSDSSTEDTGSAESSSSESSSAETSDTN
jgi:hypothetical protein